MAERENGFLLTTFTALLPYKGKGSPGVKVELALDKTCTDPLTLTHLQAVHLLPFFNSSSQPI